MKTEQLEIGYATLRNPPQQSATIRKRFRAKFLFAQMRLAVDSITGSRNGNNPPPVQTYFIL